MVLEVKIPLFVNNRDEDCELELSGISSGENLYEIVDIFGDLLNSCPAPFEIALHDIVEALPNENGELYITRIVKRSGYKVL